MPWQRLGQIWTTKGQRPWMMSHAALPTPVPLKDETYRVYFSTRDAHNRSHIAYFEIDMRDPFQVTAFSQEPVVSPGRLGTFDDSGATVSCIVRQDNRHLLYYTGWSLGVTVPFYFAIGLAVDETGNQRFTKVSEAPILDRNAVDPLLVASPDIHIEDGLWRMWYVSGVRWEQEEKEPRHYYHIRYAESQNGLDWCRTGKVCIDFAHAGEYAFSRPCVRKTNEGYQMWYAYRGEQYQLGYAESPDGIEWVRMDDKAGLTASPEGWDSEMICYPYVFEHRRKLYLLYNGNGYGKTGIGLAVWQDN